VAVFQRNRDILSVFKVVSRFAATAVLGSAFVWTSSAQTSGTTGSLDVHVTGPGGPSSGVLVVASLSVPDTTNGFSGQRGWVLLTDKTGRVSFTGLPFGLYSVCAEPLDGVSLEPCQWQAPDTVHLTAQDSKDSLSLVVRKGIPIDIRIDDPEGLVTSPTSGGLSVEIMTPNGPLHLRPAAHDAAGVNYRIIAPPSVAGSLSVSGGKLSVVDATTGAAVDFSGPAATFDLAPTDIGKSFRFRLRKSQ
jgi:hypothetical protein